METIPATFWMVIISALTALVCLILYYVAMLVKETTGTMVEVKNTIIDSRKLIQNSNAIVEDVRVSVDSIKGTVKEVNQSILGPVKAIAKLMNSIFG
ncbi:MAG TPA: hypothetical protein VHA74_03565 [Candidatus Dojkabacteria bacterium]|nr:hypothetical protein [Candidatus Dojkabacteria bacterium]